jgi:hypothetical protein
VARQADRGATASGKSRRRWGAVLGVICLVAVLVAGAVAAIGHLLNGRSPLAAPITPECTASTDAGVATLDPEQAANAALIAAVGQARGMSPRAVTIALATAMQESKLRNLDYGDRDSLGLFQQRPSQDWGTPEQIMDPLYSAGEFYKELEKVPGFETMPITEAAQAVQRSAFPDAYAQHEPTARSFASSLTGHSPAALTCALPPADHPHTPEAFLAAFRSEWGDEAADRATSDPGTPAASADPNHPATPPAVALRATSEVEAWALASWAVAKADQLGADSVEVAGQLWTRQSATWAPAPSPSGPDPGTRHGVTIDLAE